LKSRNGIEKVIGEERDIGYLDPGIEDILRGLNSLKGVSTTSSCIGRVAIVEGPIHWGRGEDTRIVFKTHGRVRPEDILGVVGRGFDSLWLRASGPILHLRVSSLDCAAHILALARPHGFKHSGVISLSREGPVVELMSAAQLSAPLIADGRLLVRIDPVSLERLAETANMVVEEGRRGLRGLVSALTASPGPCS